MELISLVRMETLVGLAAGITVITQLIKAIPADWTSNHPKVVAWTATCIIVGVIGYFEEVEVALMLTVIPPIALAAHGIYEVAKSISSKIFK